MQINRFYSLPEVQQLQRQVEWERGSLTWGETSAKHKHIWSEDSSTCWPQVSL